MVRIMDTPPHRGSGTPSPELEWTALQLSADRGDVEAQFCLGVYYSSTLGEAFDFAEAARWYRKAAEQDHALAQFNLGVMLAGPQH